MRKNRVVEQNRCYHLVSRLAHRAFFLDDEEKDRAVALMRRVEAGVKASMSCCINRTVSISSDPFAPPLKISCGLLAAVALIVGCTTEDGVVDVSACATDGVAELSAMCNDSGLSVSLKNTGKKPILVDRELVFLLLIWPLTHDRVLIPSEDESIVPKLPSSSIKDRFVILNVGESVRRTIRWNQPYKEFTCGISYPDAAVSAYESYCVLPRKEDISEIEIEYGHKYGTREGLDFYLDGAQLQNDIYEGPLKVRLLLRRNQD